jgi:HK97 family phage portal protein
MSIKSRIVTFFNKQVSESVKKSLASSTTWTGLTNPNTHIVGKYQKAQGNAGFYADSYKEVMYIFGCVWLISNTIAALPLKIFKKGDDNKKEIKDHPMYALIDKPNFKDSFYDVAESISANLELTGNTYLLNELTSGDIPTAIYSLISSKVKPIKKDKIENVKTMGDVLRGYEYGQRIGEKMYSIDEVIHEKKFSIDNEIVGMSPIQAGALTTDTVLEAKIQNFNIFKQGMSADGAFGTEQEYSEESHKRLKLDMLEKSTGVNNAHTPLLLWNGLKYSQIGINPKDLEYIKGLQMGREDICGFLYQVPLILLGVLENASYNNIKEATKIFWRFSIIPRLVKNLELWQKLLNKYGEGYSIAYDLSKVEALKEDMNDRLTRAKDYFGLGVSVKQINTILELGIKKYEGWDKGYLPFNLAEIGAEKEEEPPEPEGGKEEPPKKVLKKWTEETKIAKWKKFEAITEKVGNKYKVKLVPHFKAQEREVLSNLDKVKSIEYKKVGDNTFMFYADVYTGEIKVENNYADVKTVRKAINIESILFNEGEQVKKLVKINTPIHKEALEEAAKAEFDLLGMDVAFDVDNPRVVTWLKGNALSKAKLVTGSVKDKVKKELIKGVNAGEGVPDLKKRIVNAYGGYTKLTGSELERIARTEVIGASNHGALESYVQADVKKKGWLHARVGEIREWHLATEAKYADGVAVDKDFIIAETGTHAESPGNSGVAEEDINCHCTIIPIIED